MFNRDGFFKKDENPRSDPRSGKVTLDLGGGTPVRPQTPEASKPDRGLAEPPKMLARTDESAGSKLIVGPRITLKGVEITDCDTLVVEGRVEASMDSRVVQIAENGVFSGTATMDFAEIWGHFDGELTARKQLIIHATGHVSGYVRYGKIRIEEGGQLSGDVKALGGAQEAPSKAEPAAIQASVEGTIHMPPPRPAKQASGAGAMTV